MATKKAATKKAAATKSASKLPAAVSKKTAVTKAAKTEPEQIQDEPLVDTLSLVIPPALVIEEPPVESKKKGLLSYQDASAKLQAGKHIRRQGWPEGEYLEIIEGIAYRSITDQRKDLHTETIEDNSALDWQIK